jgi:hypothetical protein
MFTLLNPDLLLKIHASSHADLLGPFLPSPQSSGPTLDWSLPVEDFKEGSSRAC